MASLENRGYAIFNLVSLKSSKPSYIPANIPNDCGCEPYLVCGKDGGESWMKDVTGAWIKLFDATDTATFVLKTSTGVTTTYTPTANVFKSDNGYSVYTQIDWTDVLLSDGAGCYELSINYTIGGVSDTYVWGKYNLFEFSYDIVDKTIRIKSIFNDNQSLSDINFSKDNVIDTVRLGGYFGDMQPNTKIDNIIYNSREVKKVVRENVKEYTLTIDHEKYDNILYLTDLHLLSENEIYISDFNALNPSYGYLDLPCILSSSPELTYFERDRKSKLVAKFEDKVQNERSYY